MESQQKKVNVSSRSSATTCCDYILRFVVVVTTMVAALLMSLAKETKIVRVRPDPTLPAFDISVTAKSSYSSACVYFVIVNGIACAYSAFALASTSVMNKNRKNSSNTLLRRMISAVDMVVVSLLFSGNGAAGAIGVVGEKGIERNGWKKVCDVYTNFCIHTSVSIGVSLVACLVYLWLVIAIQHKRSAHE